MSLAVRRRPAAPCGAVGSKRVRAAKHLAALARVGYPPEGPAGTQLQVRSLDVVEHPSTTMAPSLSSTKLGPERDKGSGRAGQGLDRPLNHSLTVLRDKPDVVAIAEEESVVGRATS